MSLVMPSNSCVSCIFFNPIQVGGGKNYSPLPMQKNVNNEKNRQAASLPGFFTA